MRFAVLLTLGVTLAAGPAAGAAEDNADRAVAEYTDRGGRVTRDDNQPGRPVRTVDLHRAAVTDKDLVHLDGLTTLQTLDLSYTPVTDAGLKHVAGLKGLKRLALHGTRITDAGLEHLRGLANLETLFLGETRVTDRGLEHLKRLTKLEALELDHTLVSDGGLACCKGLRRLRRLELAATPVSDAGLKHLEGLTDLLVGRPLPDAGHPDGGPGPAASAARDAYHPLNRAAVRYCLRFPPGPTRPLVRES
jgi:hypothetical protein